MARLEILDDEQAYHELDLESFEPMRHYRLSENSELWMVGAESPKPAVPLMGARRAVASPGREVLKQCASTAVQGVGTKAVAMNTPPSMSMMSSRRASAICAKHYNGDTTMFNAAARKAIVSANRRAKGVPVFVTGVGIFAGKRNLSRDSRLVGITVQTESPKQLKVHAKNFIRDLVPASDPEMRAPIDSENQEHISLVIAKSDYAAQVVLERLQAYDLTGMRLQLNSVKPEPVRTGLERMQ